MSIRIVMTLLVRNEEDIIQENIDYHLSMGVDHFIVTDNLSTDRTIEILESYRDEGRVTLFHEADDIHYQSRSVTRMARLACTKYQADWVINNDADEFWWPLRYSSIKEELSQLLSHVNLIVAKRHNFVCNGEDTSRFYERMVYRHQMSLNAFGKALPPKVAHRAIENVSVSEGNHSASGFQQPITENTAIEILHFPIRSYKQFVNKVTLGGAALERNPFVSAGVGKNWRRLFRKYERSGTLIDEYKQQLFDPVRIEQGLVDGSILKDTRVRDHLRCL